MNRPRAALALLTLPLLAACQQPGTTTITAPAGTTTSTTTAPATTTSAPATTSARATSATATSATATSSAPATSAASTSAPSATASSAPTSGTAAPSTSRAKAAPSSSATTGETVTTCQEEVDLCLDAPASWTIERTTEAGGPGEPGGQHLSVWFVDGGKRVTSIQTWAEGSVLCGAKAAPGTAQVVRSAPARVTGLTGSRGSWVVQLVMQNGSDWTPLTALVSADPATLDNVCDAGNAQYLQQPSWPGFIRVASITKDDIGGKEGALAALDGPTHVQAYQVLQTAHRRG